MSISFHCLVLWNLHLTALKYKKWHMLALLQFYHNRYLLLLCSFYSQFWNKPPPYSTKPLQISILHIFILTFNSQEILPYNIYNEILKNICISFYMVELMTFIPRHKQLRQWTDNVWMCCTGQGLGTERRLILFYIGEDPPSWYWLSRECITCVFRILILI